MTIILFEMELLLIREAERSRGLNKTKDINEAWLKSPTMIYRWISSKGTKAGGMEVINGGILFCMQKRLPSDIQSTLMNKSTFLSQDYLMQAGRPLSFCLWLLILSGWFRLQTAMVAICLQQVPSATIQSWTIMFESAEAEIPPGISWTESACGYSTRMERILCPAWYTQEQSAHRLDRLLKVG